MLNDAELQSRELFSEASAILGYDLWALVQGGPAEKLNQTEFTQPALLTASIALYRLAMEQGAREPDMLAGHSLGEYSALVAAGTLGFGDAVALVQQRGQLMQSAVPVGQGGMAAVLGLDDDVVRQICADVAGGDVVQPANYNAPGQVVIAGQSAALERALEQCRAKGARKAIPLPVSAPFHSDLMRPAAEKMALVLREVTFSAPCVPVVQNLDATPHTDAETLRDNLVGQMYGAVRWTDSIRSMVASGVDTFAEIGPGRVLSGLNRRIDKAVTSHNINSPGSVSGMLEALGQ